MKKRDQHYNASESIKSFFFERRPEYINFDIHFLKQCAKLVEKRRVGSGRHPGIHKRCAAG